MTDIDPTKFNAQQLKMTGIWPPQESMSVALAPYIRRMNREVDVLFIGAGNGEDIVFLTDNCSNIKTIYGLSHTNEHDELLVANIHDNPKVQRTYGNQEVDVVFANLLPDTTVDHLALYYEKVKPGGYFVGDHHTEVFVKEALHRFRRAAKIGQPVNIVDKVVWFWKK